LIEMKFEDGGYSAKEIDLMGVPEILNDGSLVIEMRDGEVFANGERCVPADEIELEEKLEWSDSEAELTIADMVAAIYAVSAAVAAVLAGDRSPVAFQKLATAAGDLSTDSGYLEDLAAAGFVGDFVVMPDE
jgi:hypothetical protein